jgi:broad specificity phosphatase PhoE
LAVSVGGYLSSLKFIRQVSHRMSQIIWIARHGNRIDFVNPEWFNTAERRYDPPLSDDGVVQAYQLGQRLKRENITHIFASPFLRTVQTANQIAEALELPIKLESGLSEWLNPVWMTAMPEKMSIEALTEIFPRIDTSYTSRVIAEYPETYEQALSRSGKTARLLAEEFLPEDILLMGHGASVLGATMGLVGEIAKNQVKASLCCLVKVVRQDPDWLLELYGDTSHLSEIEEVIRFN